MKDTKETEKEATILEEVLGLVSKFEGCYEQTRVYRRAVGLIMGEIFGFGRHRITDLVLNIGQGEEDINSWYRLFSRGRYDEEKAAEVMVAEAVKENEGESHFVTGIDGFPIPRTSLKMPGTNWGRGLKTAKFRPGIQRSQRFVEGSWLPPRENGYSRAIPMRCLPAFPLKAVKSDEPSRKEWEAGLIYQSWLRKQLDQLGAANQRILTLADGSYDTIGFWAEKPERVDVLVRTSRNRCLYYLPPPGSHPNRLYGEKAPPPYEWLQKRKRFKRQNILVRGAVKSMRYQVIGPVVRETLAHIPLFLIVIGGGKRPPGSRRKNYKPCFFLVSAVWRDGDWQLPLPIAELLAWLWQRWELEVAHREMKSGFGVGHKECRHPRSVVSAVQWSVWVYALLLMAGYRTWKITGGPQPPGRWRRPSNRWSFNTLLRTLRAQLWDLSDFQASWHRSRANWPTKEVLLASLTNSILASSSA